VKEDLLCLSVVGLSERSEFNQNSWHSSSPEPSTSLRSYLAYETYLFIVAFIFSICNKFSFYREQVSGVNYRMIRI
jgi:hypothetical protein